jgi:hypothetical protein
MTVPPHTRNTCSQNLSLKVLHISRHLVAGLRSWLELYRLLIPSSARTPTNVQNIDKPLICHAIKIAKASQYASMKINVIRETTVRSMLPLKRNQHTLQTQNMQFSLLITKRASFQTETTLTDCTAYQVEETVLAALLVQGGITALLEPIP